MSLLQISSILMLGVLIMAGCGGNAPQSASAQPAPQADAPQPPEAAYFVDYARGSDDNNGRSPDTPFKHAPGDEQAAGRAAEVVLKPGDRVRFKGGVIYRGTIVPKWSGEAGNPIIYDGNTDGRWGEGRAIIDGSELITGWQRVADADAARGNPNWRNIYRATLPGDTEARAVSVTQGEQLFSMARDPAPRDPFYLDDRSTMRAVNPPRPLDKGRAAIDSSLLFGNRNHPLRLMIDGQDNTLAIVEPLLKATLHFHIPEPKTVTRVGITTDTRPTRPREIIFSADDTEILKKTLPNERGHFTFDLDKPVELTKLTLLINTVYDGGQRFGGIRRVQAFDADGNDVLRVIEQGSDNAHAVYSDDQFLTQTHPDHYKGSYLAIHAGHNFIYYRRVREFDPQTHTIITDAIAVPQYPGDRGRFAMLNVLGAVTQPGTFYISPETDDAGNRYIYAWPLTTGPDGPQGIAAGQRRNGFSIRGQHHITVTGFIIEKHDGEGFTVDIADANHITIRDNEIRLGRGGAIGVNRAEHLRIENNYAHHNRGRGFRVHTGTDGVVTGNRLHKNGSTGIGFYVCKNMTMSHNHVTGHKGVHANALTVYADSYDIMVEGNRTWDNNIGLTLQNSANVTVRNNIMHNGGNVLGIWTGWHKNLRIEHNTLIGSEHLTPDDWPAAVFTNGDVEGLVVRNNIISGTSGRLPGEYSNNIYTRLGPNEKDGKLPEGSVLIRDMNRLFVDPANHDYRPKPNSPSINAGAKINVDRDIEGNPRPRGNAPNIGPYEYTPE